MIPIEEAQMQLDELIDRLLPGQELLITKDDKTVARLVGVAPAPPGPRRCGTMKGTVLYMADDFDAPLEDFEDYMP